MTDSDSDEENVIRYGTPLEPFEEDEVPSKRKYQQPPDQYAVDEHGRRRFHGAFTGGFSAGFGNTVGTPEGWAPASFKSSRLEKAQSSNQKPEDFMDEEDRSEFGIAPRHMQTHSEFSGQKRPRQRQFHDGPIPGEPVLDHLIRAVHETAAVRMLRRMGWRPGQGTGERLTKGEKRKAKEQHKVYGCYVPPEIRQNTDAASDEDSTDSEFDFDTLFAPDDYEPYILARKNDRFGLGYSGLSRHSVLGNLVGEYGNDGSSRSHLVMKDKGKKVSIRGQAFGVGAFEADDEDIYATEDMSHYDFSMGSGEGNQKKPAKNRDTNVLEGFTKSTQPLPSVPSYPPPALPRDYTPAPAGTRRSRFEPTDKPQRDQGLGRHELTPHARGALLGETPLPTLIDPIPPPLPIEPDPIAKLLGRNVNFVSDTPKITEEPKELNFISIKDSGQELKPVFKPFISNPSKQTRYEKYVQNKDCYMQEQDGKMDTLSEWERNREMMEFEQAAKLYRPLSGVMGDRFTHASEPDDGVNPLSAVTKSATNYGLATPEQEDAASRGVYGFMTRREVAWRPETLVYKRFNVPEPGKARQDQKTQEKPKVAYSIFSYLESSVHDRESFAKEQSKFSGSKSLNIDATKSNQNVLPNINTREKDSGSQTQNAVITENIVQDSMPSTSETDMGFKKRLTVAELFLKESEKDLNFKNKEGTVVTETINKFDKMDLYKSIFLSDSEEEELSKPEEYKEINFESFLDIPTNVERNLSPPRGIFANINFDEINSWKRNADDKKAAHKCDDKATNPKQDSDVEKATEKVEEADLYGPKIPENLVKRLETPDTIDNFKPVFRSKTEKAKDKVETDSIVEIGSSSSDSWVDVKEVKSKKHKKKSKKKLKSKHKKSKHKKKDR